MKNNIEQYKTVKEGSDPRGGVVAIFYGKAHPEDQPGFWVEAQRTEFFSEYVSQAEAEKLYKHYLHNTQ